MNFMLKTKHRVDQWIDRWVDDQGLDRMFRIYIACVMGFCLTFICFFVALVVFVVVMSALGVTP